MIAYTDRVADFWDWFSANEHKLAVCMADLAGPERDAIIGFISDGLSRAIECALFEAGGDNEINLALEGSLPMCFLTMRLTGAMPEHLRGKWTVTPWKMPAPEGFALGMFNRTLGPADVLARVNHEEGSSGFTLALYDRDLLDLDEDSRYHLFFILLEACLGENICLSHIRGVETADAEEEGMIPLSELGGHIRETLAAEGRELGENPCRTVMAYSMEPEEADEPRFDVITGFTSLPGLLDEYYGGESAICEFFEKNGAKAGFIVYEHGEEDPAAALDLRGAIAERLETEVLGEQGGGREIGVLIGQACGLECCYLDVLLYDEQAFYDRASAMLEAYGKDMAFFYFRRDDDGVRLVVARD